MAQSQAAQLIEQRGGADNNGGGGSAVWDANFALTGLKAVGFGGLAPEENVGAALFIDRDGYQGAITVTPNPAELAAVTAGDGTFEVLYDTGTTTTDIPAGVSAVQLNLDSGTLPPGTYPLTITLQGGGITQTVVIQYTFL